MISRVLFFTDQFPQGWKGWLAWAELLIDLRETATLPTALNAPTRLRVDLTHNVLLSVLWGSSPSQPSHNLTAMCV